MTVTYQHREMGPSYDRRDVWFVDEGDAWKVMCMDCGIRVGTVNAGNEDGAYELAVRHDRILHDD